MTGYSMSECRTNISLSLPLLLIAIIWSACSGIDTPDNLEPIISMTEASDVTRTDAVISARIDRRSPAKLSYITLFYGISGSDQWTSVACNADADNIILRIEGLTPGTTYSCYAEAGTATASLRSNVINFTTIPNSLPAISPIDILSTGPVSIIVGLCLTDDGGEAVTQAGCDITCASDGETSRVLLPAEELSTGYHKLVISGLTVSTSYTITPFASNSIGTAIGQATDYTTRASIMLEDAGQLSTLLTSTPGSSLSQPLTIAGKMDGDDFRFLRGMLGAPVSDEAASRYDVEAVDITDVIICSGGSTYDGSHFTVDNVLTNGIFADCVRLQSIILPATASQLERDAIARCTALRQLTIPAGITRLLPSSGCTALSSIDVSPANDSYASVDGVLFDREISGILWFPCAKTGNYTLPATVTTIAEDAFAGTSITGLEIPPSVTEIKRGAFAESSLVEISLPDNIANITTGMFQNCAALTTVHLGSGTQLIGGYVFDGTSMTDLYVAATIPPVADPDAFTNKSTSITGSCTLHVPAGCKAVYRNHQRWGRFEKIVEF